MAKSCGCWTQCGPRGSGAWASPCTRIAPRSRDRRDRGTRVRKSIGITQSTRLHVPPRATQVGRPFGGQGCSAIHSITTTRRTAARPPWDRRAQYTPLAGWEATAIVRPCSSAPAGDQRSSATIRPETSTI